jgi:hypothetical protein
MTCRDCHYCMMELELGKSKACLHSIQGGFSGVTASSFDM